MRQPDPTKSEAPVATTTGASKTENQNHQVKEIVLSDSTNYLIPVNFHDAELYLVNHEDQPYTPMKPIVEGMGLTWHGQHRKLQGYSHDENTNKRWGILELRIPSDGGPQNMLCMPLRKLPAWLSTLEPSRIKNPQIRTRIIQYQNECDDALWDYWNTWFSPGCSFTRGFSFSGCVSWGGRKRDT